MLIALEINTTVLIVILVAVIIALLAGFYIFVYLMTTDKIYHKVFDRRKPMPQVDRSPRDIDQSTITGRGLAWFYTNRMEFLNVRIRAFDGTSLCAYYRPSADRQTRNCVILVHGYNEHPANMACYARLLMSKMQCHVLIVHQRAHHMSGGKISTYGLMESVDLEYWIRFMKRRSGPGARIYLMGRSMGAVTCLLAAAQKDIDPAVCGVIADCPGDTLMNVLKVSGEKRYKRDCTSYLRRVRHLGQKRLNIDIARCDVVQMADKIRVPVLIFQCGDDNITPPRMQEEVFDSLRCPKRMIMVEHAKHMEAYEKQPAMYEREITRFIETCVIRLVKMGMM
ncbi:Lysophospholipase, alpha-beta hydrolase superfamily [Ruminococcaceae bacterium YRB3002]|nr:Lysophospholipase, alpha-beta hydrolase superfamily [Ruminococcaceae bacterium YRB3002]